MNIIGSMGPRSVHRTKSKDALGTHVRSCMKSIYTCKTDWAQRLDFCLSSPGICE